MRLELDAEQMLTLLRALVADDSGVGEMLALLALGRFDDSLGDLSHKIHQLPDGRERRLFLALLQATDGKNPVSIASNLKVLLGRDLTQALVLCLYSMADGPRVSVEPKGQGDVRLTGKVAHGIEIDIEGDFSTVLPRVYPEAYGH